MDPKLTKGTQDSLGKIIKKPPLTDKLLGKPPFRFLHDIMTSVIKSTGFMKGLYTDSEMNSDNVKDKDSKMAFLQKAVDMVSLVLGSQLSVRPSKVVAGHEPEKTNEFLQALAAAINKNVNNDDFVQRVLNGDKGDKESKSKDDKKERRSREKGDKEEKKSRERSSDKRKEEKEGRDKEDRRERSRDKERGRDEKDRHREKDRDREKDKEREREKDHDREKDREKDRSKDRGKDGEKDRDRHKDREQRDKEHKSKKEDISLSSPKPSYDRKIGIKSRLRSRPSDESVKSLSKESVGSSQGSYQRLNDSPAERQSSSSGTERRISKTKVQQRRTSTSRHSGPIKDKRKSSSSAGKDARQSEDTRDRGAFKAESDSPVQSSTKLTGKHRKSVSMLVTNPRPSHMEIVDPPTKRAERPTSAKGSRRRRDEDMPSNQMRQESSGGGTLGEDDLPPQVTEARKLARPSSARPAAPRVKNKDAVTDEPAMRLGSGKPTNVIFDNDQSDDDDNFMVEDSAPAPLTIEREKTMLGVENDEEHGGLVKKILESKKEFEGGNQKTSAPVRKTEIERPTMSDAARRKEREMVQKEIDKLRGSIQTVTRSANPLGKIMDYVQEDLDAMQKELDVWKKENKEQTLALKREQSITDKAIEPLKAQLSEIDQAIVDQMDLIAAVKSNIISNDQKIEKMLRSISKS